MIDLKHFRKTGDVPAVLLERIESDWSAELPIFESERQGPRVFCAACGFCSKECYRISDLRKNKDVNVENRGR